MVQYDWTDIAKLNYENEDMRKEMLKAMHFWMDEIGVDGFRCDVAGEVPTDFWEMAMSDLRLTHRGTPIPSPGEWSSTSRHLRCCDSRHWCRARCLAGSARW